MTNAASTDSAFPKLLSFAAATIPFSKPMTFSCIYLLIQVKLKVEPTEIRNHCSNKKNSFSTGCEAIPAERESVQKLEKLLTKLAGNGRSEKAWARDTIAACCCSVNGAFYTAKRMSKLGIAPNNLKKIVTKNVKRCLPEIRSGLKHAPSLSGDRYRC